MKLKVIYIVLNEKGDSHALLPFHNISKKNTFFLSQNISKNDKLLSFPRFFFILIKLNANYFQFSLSFIFSITNSQ